MRPRQKSRAHNLLLIDYSQGLVGIHQVKRSKFTVGSCQAVEDQLRKQEDCEQSFLSIDRVTFAFLSGYIDLADMSGSEG